MSKPPIVRCPDCGTPYKWRPDFAGKQLHCRCGCTFTPEAPADAAAAPPPPDKPKLPFGPVPSPVQQALDAGAFEAAPPTFTDKLLPAILLAAGFPLGLLVTWLITGKLILFAACAAGLVCFEAIVGVPLMLGTIMWMASAFGEGFGKLTEVLWKVGATSLGPGLIADAAFAYFMTNIHLMAYPTLYVGGFGGGFAIYFLLQGLPLWIMLRTHPGMIGGLIACAFTVRFGLFFAAFYALRPFWP